MSKNRLEAFSDGVLAIIITIMVLELRQPSGGGFRDLWRVKSEFFAYGLSFLFIAIYWVNHHLLFAHVERINLKIIWCNIVWLFAMSFIPFSTVWVGSHLKSRTPIALYFGIMFVACVSFHIMSYLIACEKGEKHNFKLSARNIISLITYFSATVFGGVYPLAAYIVVAVVSLWWIFPEKKHKTNNDK